MTMTCDKTLEEAESALTALQSELDEIEDRVSAARRAGDSKLWMSRVSRAELLPAEIRDARVAVLRLRLVDRWAVVDGLYQTELSIAAEIVAASAELSLMDAAVRVDVAGVAQRIDGPGQVDALARSSEINAIEARAAAKRFAVNELRGRARTSQEETAAALYEIDCAELELAELTGDAPVDGDGLRAVPGELTRGFHWSSLMFTSTTIPDRVRFQEARFYEVGSRPPRWLAHLLGRHLFEPVEDAPAISEPEVVEPVGFTLPNRFSEAQYERHMANGRRRQQRKDDE